MKLTLLTTIFILSLVWVEPAWAQGFVPCTGSSFNGGVACTECHFIQMGNTVLKWLIGVLFVVFAVVAAMGGFGLVTSGGNPEAKSAAKQKLVNALVGILIVLAAWLLVDTIIRGLLSDGSGKINGTFWYEVECGSQIVSEWPSPDSTAAVTGTYGFQAFTYDAANSCTIGHSGSYPTQAACEAAVAAVEASATNFYLSKQCDDNLATYSKPSWASTAACGTSADPSADGSFSYQPGISAQAGHMSPQLSSMLTCMAGIVPGSVGVISSISDSLIASGAKTWAQCRLSPKQCAHTPTSYHYGHSGACGDKSYAVDFGDEGNSSVLCAAANSCGTIKNCSVHNGNHVHLELPCP